MQHQTERKQNVNRRESVGELAASSEAQYPSRPAHVETSGLVRSFPLLPGETSGPPQRCGSRRVRKDLMARGPEESDGRVLPQGRLTASPTANRRGGKATTDQEVVRQQELFAETADSPQGDSGGADPGRPGSATCEVPKSENTNSSVWPAMTMEEVARPENLRQAFERVAENQGAPGADRQSIEQVRQGLPKLLPKLSRALGEGTYRPGDIQRVNIPKPGGRERGHGIPIVASECLLFSRRLECRLVARVFGGATCNRGVGPRQCGLVRRG